MKQLLSALILPILMGLGLQAVAQTESQTAIDATTREKEKLSLTDVRQRLRGMDSKERHALFNKTKRKWRRLSAEEKDAFRKDIKNQLARRDPPAGESP